MKKTIDPIRNGTVIDHIKAGQGLNVLQILNLPFSEETFSIGIRLNSTRFGKKDMIMFENVELNARTLSIVALIAPDATISIIQNEKVVKKEKATLPDSVERVITCPNPNCITNVVGVKTRFKVIKGNRIEVRCSYCEKRYPIDTLQIEM